MKKIKSNALEKSWVFDDLVFRRDKKFKLFVIIVLLGFGIYQSIMYFGFQMVPNPDFTGFVITGRELLSFNLPSDFTRAPVLGILIVGLSHLIGGSYPELTAGWLLNAILHPLILLLLWLVGREIIGNSARWIALIAILNPGVIRLLPSPIVETTLLFFILITFYFIFRRSRWSYLFASITTMVRYEGAVLILTAFTLDIIIRKTRKERILTFLYSFIAILPLLIWLLGEGSSPDGNFYLKTFNHNSGFLSQKIYDIWEVTFSSLVRPIPPLVNSSIIFTISKIIAVVGFIFGMAYGLVHRRWKIMALLIFLAGYFFIHIFYFSFWRYWVPVFWIVFFIWWYGLLSFWRWIKWKELIPDNFMVAGFGVVLAVAGLWFIFLLTELPGINSIGKKAVSFPYVAIGVVGVLYIGRLFYYRAEYWFRDLTVLVLVCLLIISNQYTLVKQLGDPKHDIEFKYLAEWYRENARPDDKMVCTMSPILQVFAPEYESNFICNVNIKSKSPQDFIDQCRRRGITYVAWDSRICAHKKWRFYKLWGLDNIAMLSQPRNIGPYVYVTQLINDNNPNKIINIFRLQP